MARLVAASPIFLGTFWIYGLINATGIFRFREVTRYSGLYEFHSCAFYRKVSHRELFANIPFLPLFLAIVFCQSLHKMHDHVHRWESEQKLCSVWKLPFYQHRAIKFMQNCVCFTNLCISLLVLPSVTHEIQPKILQLLHLLTKHGKRLRLISVDTNTNVLAGIQWLDGSRQHHTPATLSKVFHEERGRAFSWSRLDFSKNLLERQNVFFTVRPGRKPFWVSCSLGSIISWHLFSRHLA